MEIKCKVSFTLPEELVDALELTDDTPIIASVSGNRITLEFADDEFEDRVGKKSTRKRKGKETDYVGNA